jgi:hypothetical protein
LSPPRRSRFTVRRPSCRLVSPNSPVFLPLRSASDSNLAPHRLLKTHRGYQSAVVRAGLRVYRPNGFGPLRTC